VVVHELQPELAPNSIGERDSSPTQPAHLPSSTTVGEL